MNSTPSLTDWINHIFDHPVTDPEWHWDIDVKLWDDDIPPQHSTLLIAETFEHAGGLLSRFTDAQINQGLWYLISGGCSYYMHGITDPEVPMALRLRALRSFVPFFEQVMASRCSPHLSHLDEPGANPLNSSCYMWWDIIPFHGRPDEPERAEIDAEALKIIERILAIPHDACRESSLHGIGHWIPFYQNATSIVDDFLTSTPDLRPELIAYAKQARTGYIQ